MPKRRFVESAAEEKSAPITDANPDAGPSTSAQNATAAAAPAKKRKRRGTRGKVPLLHVQVDLQGPKAVVVVVGLAKDGAGIPD
jgi:hypothetical protein